MCPNKDRKVDSAQCAVICRNPLAALGVATKALLRSRLTPEMGARRENTVFLTSKCELIVFDAIKNQCPMLILSRSGKLEPFQTYPCKIMSWNTRTLTFFLCLTFCHLWPRMAVSFPSFSLSNTAIVVLEAERSRSDFYCPEEA